MLHDKLEKKPFATFLVKPRNVKFCPNVRALVLVCTLVEIVVHPLGYVVRIPTILVPRNLEILIGSLEMLANTTYCNTSRYRIFSNLFHLFLDLFHTVFSPPTFTVTLGPNPSSYSSSIVTSYRKHKYPLFTSVKMESRCQQAESKRGIPEI